MTNMQEKQAFEYIGALERGDIDTLQSILHEAIHDRVLSQMISEVHEALESETPAGIPPSLNHSRRRQNMQLVQPLYPNGVSRNKPQQVRHPLLAAAGVILAMLLVGLLIGQINQNTSNPFAGALQPEVDQKEIVFQRYIDEVWNNGNVDILDEILTESHRYVDELDTTDLYIGIEETRTQIVQLRTLAADIHFTIHETIMDDDQLVARMTLEATGILAEDLDGEPRHYPMDIAAPTTIIVTFEGDRIDRTRISPNTAGFMFEFFAIILGLHGTDLETIEIENKNEQVARKYIENVWNNPGVDAETIASYHDSTFTQSDGSNEPYPVTPEDYQDDLRGIHQAFSDFQFEIDFIAADGLDVIVGYTMSGLFERPMCLGCRDGGGVVVSPTHEHVSWSGTMTLTLNREQEILSEANQAYMNDSLIELYMAAFGQEN